MISSGWCGRGRSSLLGKYEQCEYAGLSGSDFGARMHRSPANGATKYATGPDFAALYKCH